ncbi:site-specific DNA-methyltransferase [Candidatus Spongiihabitans sp.]|uniref:site-specific DNA-methyltransferase n=1 Tax=Candidatus Spongiihabitans sp. TaxID=3101308 RepID=UPI003C6F4057
MTQTLTKKPPKKPIEQYEHADKQRVNNPQVGLVTPNTDPDKGEKKTWEYDPHLDPALQWAGKAEHTSFEVPTVSLHVHERIDTKTIIGAVSKAHDDGGQASLFTERRPLREAIAFYRHKDNWSNRLIAGDSLLVMNSLLEKEGMSGKVQCVYMDPPYGIKYGSNFQPFVGKRDVKDGKDEDLTAEPEQIRAFRDTWELGIHSYLSYLRDRLLLARELLTDSGSVFVQIGDENVHRVGLAMDDIFGAQNRVATISFATTSGSSTSNLPQVADYLLWYAKDKGKIKYRQLYESLSRAGIVDYFNWDVMAELSDGTCRKLTDEERFDPDKFLPQGARIYRRTGLDSQGVSTTGRSEPYQWNGRTFHCSKNRHWSISKEGMDRLSEIGRLEALEGQGSLMWKRYEEEAPGRRINNLWPAQMYPSEKRYVVETSVKAIQRCMLMTTDPGDLVFDPTCGSGTTAYVAEHWGRRWMTCDTSRVALTLARQRLMTANFDYYRLAYPDEGVGSGFQYKSVSKVSPSILSGNAPASQTTLYNQPIKDTKKARITGPFTVEAVPAPYAKNLDELEQDDTTGSALDTSIARSGETLRQSEWRDELLRTGVRGKNNQKIMFSRVEPLSGTRYIQAEAETTWSNAGADSVADGPIDCPQKVLAQKAWIVFGPEHAPLEQRQVEMALQEADNLRPKAQMILFVAFQFDPEAAKDIDETNWPGMTLLKVQMNADLQTDDLKKQRASNESFWLVGQPDVSLRQIRRGPHTDKWQVEVRGFDYFNTKTGDVESGNAEKIAVWMLDTDYDGRSLYPNQVFFPMAGRKDGWSKLARNLKAEIDEDLIEAYKGCQSLPFELGENKRIAVKIVDDRGIESLRVVGLA